MTAPESSPQQPEQQFSSFKVKDQFKGEPPSISVTVVEGVTEDEMTRLRVLALAEYRAAKAEAQA